MFSKKISPIKNLSSLKIKHYSGIRFFYRKTLQLSLETIDIRDFCDIMIDEEINKLISMKIYSYIV